jgi:hypothetical protein
MDANIDQSRLLNHHANHNCGGDDDDEHAFLLEDSTSFKEEDGDYDSEIDENENADELHLHDHDSNSSSVYDNHCPRNLVTHRKKNNINNLFVLDHDDDDDDDDFPLLFGGRSRSHHGLESAAAGESGLVFPVGGMRRVSSCYFSIASAASSTNNNDYFTCVNGSSGGGGGGNILYNLNNNNIHSSATPSVHNNTMNNMDDFLLHDVLMNVFSYLDGRSLASFSETGRRPNFECFFFCELQLQRALLVGDSHYYCGLRHCSWDDDDEDNNDRVDDYNGASVQGDDIVDGGHVSNDPHQSPINNGVISSFEGSIAGTGVISRLASMDRDAARRIVQTYLDSNTSIHAMPLRHSLAYFRQMLLRYKHHPPFAPTLSSSPSSPFPHGTMPNIPENMAKMALFFTFLGAAYMHHHGGDVMMPSIPGPSEVLNEENMEVLKNMMLKVGLAGGFLKAGKTMKEKAVQQQANISAAAESASTTNDGVSNASGENVVITDHRGMNDIGEVKKVRNDNNDASEGNGDLHSRDLVMRTNERINGDDDNDTSPNATGSLVKDADPSSHQHQRSVSIGSLEDLSHMMPNASAIALRLYNAFSNANSSRLSPQMQSKDKSKSKDPNVNIPLQASKMMNESSLSPKRRRRSKRSHKTLHSIEGDFEGNDSTSTSEGDTTVSLEQDADCSDTELTPSKHEAEPLEISHFMDHLPSPSSVILRSVVTSEDENNQVAATSFFSFGGANQESLSSSLDEDGHVPTGCVGAYARAVKTAASEVTRLVKEERRANFERLSPEDQIELGVRFIDACTSDDKLPIVKEILQKQKNMDVDRFFIGPDDTETCALHAGELFLYELCLLKSSHLLIWRFISMILVQLRSTVRSKC